MKIVLDAFSSQNVLEKWSRWNFEDNSTALNQSLELKIHLGCMKKVEVQSKKKRIGFTDKTRSIVQMLFINCVKKMWELRVENMLEFLKSLKTGMLNFSYEFVLFVNLRVTIFFELDKDLHSHCISQYRSYLSSVVKEYLISAIRTLPFQFLWHFFWLKPLFSWDTSLQLCSI